MCDKCGGVEGINKVLANGRNAWIPCDLCHAEESRMIEQMLLDGASVVICEMREPILPALSFEVPSQRPRYVQ